MSEEAGYDPPTPQPSVLQAALSDGTNSRALSEAIGEGERDTPMLDAMVCNILLADLYLLFCDFYFATSLFQGFNVEMAPSEAPIESMYLPLSNNLGAQLC